MSKVCHFLRKSSQLRASFINNQISNHVNYQPYVINRIEVVADNDGGYAEFVEPVTRLSLGETATKFEQFLYKGPKILSGRQVNKINQFLSNHAIDIAHFHYGTDSGVYYPLTRNLQIPSVVSFYGYDISSYPRYMMGYGKQYLNNRVFRQVTKILAMTPDMKNDLINAGCPEAKIIVHYYGTDCTKFYHDRVYMEKDVVTILTLSNLCPKKGHIFQFQALKLLLNQGVTNFRFRVVGSGVLEQELKSYVLNNDLTGHVHFVGPLKYGSVEMMEEIKNADIFLHPSVVARDGDKEGIPGTIIEAMASGLPVVTTYHAGIPYVIKNEDTGLLVKEWDVKALSSALHALIESRDLRETIGKAAQNHAMKNLDLAEKEKELEQIYTRVISGFVHKKKIATV